MHYCELVESVPIPSRRLHISQHTHTRTHARTHTHTHTHAHTDPQKILTYFTCKTSAHAPSLLSYCHTHAHAQSPPEKSFRWSSPPLWDIDYRLPGWSTNVVCKGEMAQMDGGREAEERERKSEREREREREREKGERGRLIDGSKDERYRGKKPGDLYGGRRGGGQIRPTNWSGPVVSMAALHTAGLIPVTHTHTHAHTHTHTHTYFSQSHPSPHTPAVSSPVRDGQPLSHLITPSGQGLHQPY